MDIRKYWKARRDLEATLEEATYLTSVQDDARGWIGGRVFACGRETGGNEYEEPEQGGCSSDATCSLAHPPTSGSASGRLPARSL